MVDKQDHKRSNEAPNSLEDTAVYRVINYSAENGRFSRAVRSSKRCPVHHPHLLEGPYLATTATHRSSLLTRGSNVGELDNRKRTRGKAGQLQGQETPMPAPATTGTNTIESSSTLTTNTRVAGSRSYRSSSKDTNNTNSVKLSRPKARQSLATGPPESSEKDKEDTSKAAHHYHCLELDDLPARERRRMPGAAPLARVRTGEARPPPNSSTTNKTSSSNSAASCSSSSSHCHRTV